MYLKKVKEKNIAAVLDIIDRYGPISKKEVAIKLGLSPASLTLISKNLLEDNMLIEVGEVNENKAGRRKQLLKINYKSNYSVGIYIARSRTVISIIDLKHKIIDSVEVPNIKKDEYKAFLKELASKITALIEKNIDIKDKILGVGVTLMGRVDSKHGKTSSNIGFWDEAVDVKKELSEYLDYPLMIENNVSALALYEASISPEFNKFFFVKYDRGIGGATIVNSTLNSENNDSMGELGHSVVDINSKEYCPMCKRKGCLENSISTNKIVELIKYDFNEEDYPILHKLINGNKDRIDFTNILKSAELGGLKECLCIKKSAKLIAITLLNINSLMVPEKIIIHGRLFRSALYMDYLMTYLREYQLTNFSEKLYQSKIPSELVVLAPAVYVLRRVFYERSLNI